MRIRHISNALKYYTFCLLFLTLGLGAKNIFISEFTLQSTNLSEYSDQTTVWTNVVRFPQIEQENFFVSKSSISAFRPRFVFRAYRIFLSVEIYRSDVEVNGTSPSSVVVTNGGGQHLLHNMLRKYFFIILKKKRRPLYLKTQFVPRCKHFSSGL